MGPQYWRAAIERITCGSIARHALYILSNQNPTVLCIQPVDSLPVYFQQPRQNRLSGVRVLLLEKRS